MRTAHINTMSKRRKGFLTRLSDSIKDSRLDGLVTEKKPAPRKKGFLDAFDEEIDDDALTDLIPVKKTLKREKREPQKRVTGDDILFGLMPERSMRKKTTTRTVKKPARKPHVSMSTSVERDTLKKIRQIADSKEATIKETVNKALKAYIDKHWKPGMR